MIIKSVNLETVCGITSKLPENEFSEFAFAGKSNVGKSSLINGLISRKAYARTSAEPGKTQTINYYKVEYREKSQKEIEAQGLDASYAQEKSVYFVDLPNDRELSAHLKAVKGSIFARRYSSQAVRKRLPDV